MRRTNLTVREQMTRERARGQMQSMICTSEAKESFKHIPYYNTSENAQNPPESILNHSVRKLSTMR